ASAARLWTGAVRARPHRRRSGATRRGVGRRTARDRTSSRGKRFAQWQSDACLFRDHRCVGGREGHCFAILGGQRSIARWIHCCDLWRIKATPLLGPAPRRSALREDRRLVSAKRGEQVNAAMDPNKFFAEQRFTRSRVKYWEI